MAAMHGRLLGVLGIPSEIKPIVGLPEGRARLRLRREDFAQVFVKTPTGIRRFYISDVGRNWIAEIEIESNQTIQ
jgi:hypothetical protein